MLNKVYTKQSHGVIPLPDSPYSFELYAKSGDDCSLTWHGHNERGGAVYEMDWKNAAIFLGRLGLYFNEGKPPSHYEDISCDFEFSRDLASYDGIFSWAGIYGWTQDPLIEYNILEDRFDDAAEEMTTYRLQNHSKKIGTYFLDGSEYALFRGLRLNENSIIGVKTFPQYYAFRKDFRQSGTVSVSEHFKAWERMGLALGTNLYEVKFFVEISDGVGHLSVPHLLIRSGSKEEGSASNV